MTNGVITKLEASDRLEGKNPRQLRAMGFLPVTVYGKDLNLNLQIGMHEFRLAYLRDKETNFEIVYNKKPYSVTAKNVQTNYATGEIQSVEFTLA